jgi:hypothetical protein
LLADLAALPKSLGQQEIVTVAIPKGTEFVLGRINAIESFAFQRENPNLDLRFAAGGSGGEIQAWLTQTKQIQGETEKQEYLSGDLIIKRAELRSLEEFESKIAEMMRLQDSAETKNRIQKLTQKLQPCESSLLEISKRGSNADLTSLDSCAYSQEKSGIVATSEFEESYFYLEVLKQRLFQLNYCTSEKLIPCPEGF